MPNPEATVTAEVADDTFSFIDDMDSDLALGWLYLTEPALAVKIRSTARNLLRRLEEQHHLNLQFAQRAAVLRTVVNTAISAAVALTEGHHLLWQDLGEGSLLPPCDPWIDVKHRVAVDAGPRSPSRPKPVPKSRKVTGPRGRVVLARKLSIRSCLPGRDESVSPQTGVLVLTSVAPDRTIRHEMVSKRDGEALLKALVHALTAIGSTVGEAAWPAVCGGDAALDPPKPGSRDETKPDGCDDEDDEGDAEVLS